MANKLEIVINTSANVSGIKQASSTLNDLQHSATGVSKTTDQVSSSINGLSSKVTKVTGLLAGAFAFDKLTDSATSFISTAGQFEQYATSLEVLTGSAANAGTAFDWVKEFTAKTPYELDQTMEAFIRLKAYGIDATDGSLRVLGDTSAALGKPLMSAVEAMADAMTGENERLKEFGITASVSGNKVAYNWIDSSGQAKTKIIENNKQIIKSTLETIFNEKYAGMMDKQSQTLNGMVSNFQDAWTGIKDSFANDSGAFDASKSAIAGATELLQSISENKDEILTYGKYVAQAGTALVAYKGVMIGINTVQKLHTSYVAASTIATTSYSIATNMTTASVTRLTARQMAANVALGGWNKLVALNPYAIAGAAMIGVGLVLVNQADQLRDSLKRTAVDVDNLSAKALQAKITYSTLELGKVNNNIKNPSLLKSAFGNERIDLNRKVQLENELKAYGKQLQKLDEEANKPSSTAGNTPKNIPTEEELKAAKAAAKSLADAYKDINDQIFNISASDHDKALKAINDYAAEKRKVGVDELTIAKYVSGEKAALNKKELKDLGDDMNSARAELETKFTEAEAKDTEATLNRWADSKSALVDYYDTMGDKSNAFYITESDKIQKLAETGILSNEQLVAVWDKDFAHMQDSTIKLNTVFEDAFKSMEDSMVSMFMTGKFSAEDFFNTVIEGIIRMQIRNSITEPLTQAIGGVNFGSMFSGVFGGSAVSGVGSEFGVVDGVSYGGFSSGGYTGDGGKYEPKGVVHGGEYVIPKWMVQKSPALIGSLESTRKRGYADGGLVNSELLGGSGGMSMPVTINIENKSGTPISAESVTPQFDGRSMVINVVIDAITRNAGGMRDAVRSVR